jgi:CheY-like chemotaxis protein
LTGQAGYANKSTASRSQTFVATTSGGWYKNYINWVMVVLNVDDDQEDREFFCDALREIDPSITCLIAGSGMEALSLLQKVKPLPDYIFLDINMPMMDGKQCLKALKSLAELESIPVIMYSTSTDTREIQECYKLGAEDFLIKPHSFEKLVNDLNSIFALSRRSPI